MPIEFFWTSFDAFWWTLVLLYCLSCYTSIFPWLKHPETFNFHETNTNGLLIIHIAQFTLFLLLLTKTALSWYTRCSHSSLPNATSTYLHHFSSKPRHLWLAHFTVAIDFAIQFTALFLHSFPWNPTFSSSSSHYTNLHISPTPALQNQPKPVHHKRPSLFYIPNLPKIIYLLFLSESWRVLLTDHGTPVHHTYSTILQPLTNPFQTIKIHLKSVNSTFFATPNHPKLLPFEFHMLSLFHMLFSIFPFFLHITPIQPSAISFPDLDSSSRKSPGLSIARLLWKTVKISRFPVYFHVKIVDF